jgi:hypothetical protein
VDAQTQINVAVLNAQYDALNDDLKTGKIMNFVFFACLWLPLSTPIFFFVFWCCFARHEKFKESFEIFKASLNAQA